MATGFETDQDTSRDIVGEHPIPDRWRACLICGLCKDPFCRLETIGLGHANWKPDDVQEEIEHDDASRQPENVAVRLRIKIVHPDGYEQEDLGYDPLYSTKLDVVDISREVYTKYGDLREEKIGCTLAIGGKESGPGRATPPSNNEAKKPAITAST